MEDAIFWGGGPRVTFEWDDAKSASNRTKHGIAFDAAALVFQDDLRATRLDQELPGETRWRTFGQAMGVLLLVIHTWEGEGDDAVVRLISARRADRRERRAYEAGTI